MLSKIVVYKVNLKRGFLGDRTYTKQDITNQLEMPIYDTAQRDGVLDTSSISLVNKNKNPLKPFTRIIIELHDTTNKVETVEKIYRYVDNDSVTNVARGSSPIYRHSITLVEITKILERRPVDNLTFTNYLKDAFVNSRAVEYKHTNKYMDYTSTPLYTTDSDRIIGPYHVLDAENPEKNTISTKIKLIVKAEERRRLFGFIVLSSNWKDVPLKSFYVKKPDGTTQDLSTSGTFTYTQTGVYVFVQEYIYHMWESYELWSEYTDCDCHLEWRVEVVSSEIDSVRSYNALEAVERLLKCHKTLVNYLDTQEFYLDDNIKDRLEPIKVPEFTITQGTLFEALCQIGNYIHAIPRLIPNIDGEDDYSRWNRITFDFLDDMSRIEIKNYSITDKENPLSEFATSFVSNVQNATVSNYSGKSSAIEPVRNGFLSTRTESSAFEVSDNECIIKTSQKIRSIVKVQIIVGQTTYDITQAVVEKALYNTKFTYSGSSDPMDNFLYYETGKENIYGLSYTRKQKNAGIIQEFPIEAIKRIIGYSGDIKDLSFNVEYIPFVDFKAKQYNSFYDNEQEESTLYFNQQANIVDVDDYGENMHFALTKTGNEKTTNTSYYKNLGAVPRCGQYVEDGKDKQVVFQVNRELISGTPIKATTCFAKNYQELFAQIAVKSAIRQFEISETEAIERNLDVQSFCIVDNKLDLDTYFSGSYENYATTELKEQIKRKLWDGFGHSNNMNALATHFSKESGVTERISTAVICRIYYIENNKRVVKNILIPATFHPFGRSVACRFSMQDNYSAQTYIDTSKTGTQYMNIVTGETVDSIDDTPEDLTNWMAKPKGSYAIENYIKYSNTYGRADFLDFAFINKFKNDDAAIKRETGYYLYDLDKVKDGFFTLKYDTSVMFGYGDANHSSIILDKDSREKISLTCQLNFITQNKNIETYRALVDTLPYVCDSPTTYKFVVFEEEQSKETDHVYGNVHELGEGVLCSYDKNVATLTITPKSSSIKASCDGKGYGLITNDNRACIFIKQNIKAGQDLSPIRLMMRHNI